MIAGVVDRPFRLILFTFLVAGALLTRGGLAQSQGGSFEPLGVRGDRAYFSQFPFESIDMVTGNLNLSFTDVVLPGNAGMSVAIVRTMNFGGGSSGPIWSVGLGGVPVAIVGATAPPSGPWHVGVMMGDGSRHTVPHQSGVDTYVLHNFMRLKLSTRTVDLPNGWSATYESTAGVLEAQLEEVRDPYDNSIAATWLPRPPQSTLATKITSVELRGGSDPARTVYINYDPTGVRLQTVTSEGRTWTYGYTNDQLTSVDPPAGPAWQFDYDANEFELTTPNGGTVTYRFQNVDDGSGHTHPVITSRTVGGRAVTSGTWTFSFNRSVMPVVGTVNRPDGRRLEYQHQSTADPAGGTYWRLTRATLLRGSTEISRLDRTYTACGDSFLPMVSTATIQQDGRTFTTSFEYRAAYENNCDFHRPYRM